MKNLISTTHLGTIVALAILSQSLSAATGHHQSANKNRKPSPANNELVIDRFDRSNEVAQWKFASGLPGSKLAFDPNADAGGRPMKGSMKFVLPFTKDGEFDFNLDKFSPGIDLKARGFNSIRLDVKVDPKSPAWGDFHAGWFELGIRTGKEGHTFVKQYGENLDTRKGWFHLSVPIVGDVSDVRGFAVKFFASGLTTGNRVVWIDNLVLSKVRVASTKPIQHVVPRLTAQSALKPGAEMLSNGNFSDGMSKWVLEQSGSAKGAAEVVPEGPGGKPAMRLKVLSVEDHAWHLQIYQTGMRIEKGKQYSMSFWAKAARPGVITAECNQNHEPWEHETNVKLPVTTSWTLLHFNFKGPWEDDNVRISFTDLGTVAGQTYWFADCSLKSLLPNHASPAPAIAQGR